MQALISGLAWPGFPEKICWNIANEGGFSRLRNEIRERDRSEGRTSIARIPRASSYHDSGPSAGELDVRIITSSSKGKKFNRKSVLEEGKQLVSDLSNAQFDYATKKWQPTQSCEKRSTASLNVHLWQLKLRMRSSSASEIRDYLIQRVGKGSSKIPLPMIELISRISKSVFETWQRSIQNSMAVLSIISARDPASTTTLDERIGPLPRIFTQDGHPVGVKSSR